MTVRDLIERLQEMPDYYEVHASDPDDLAQWPLSEIEQAPFGTVVIR